MNYGVIYLIWNMLNGKKYVGQTKLTVKERFNQHAKCKKSLIGKAIHKYGRKNFRYGVIEICDTLEQLNECEKYWITALRCKSPVGYNRTDGGFNSGGHKQSAKTRAKIGLANKNLLTEMDKRQLSYKELARLLELSTSTISNRMHGLFNFTGKDIAKLVEIFGKPLEYLIARVDD